MLNLRELSSRRIVATLAIVFINDFIKSTAPKLGGVTFVQD